MADINSIARILGIHVVKAEILSSSRLGSDICHAEYDLWSKVHTLKNLETWENDKSGKCPWPGKDED